MVSVSIIIPFHNEGKLLEKAIQSALDQTVKIEEVILVNNCSDRQTLEIAQKRVKEFPDKIRLVSESSKGSPHARNKGLQVVKGDWIQYLDADDIIAPKKIESQLPFCTIVNGAIASPFTEYFSRGGKQTFFTDEPDDWIALIETKFGVTSSILWNKKALLKVNGWDSEYSNHQEYELLFKLLKEGFTIARSKINLTQKMERKEGSIISNTRYSYSLTDFEFRYKVKRYLLEKGWLDANRKKAVEKRMFVQLRQSYANYPELTTQYFHESFDRDFFPYFDHFFYRFLFSTVGFESAQKIIGWARKIFPRKK